MADTDQIVCRKRYMLRNKEMIKFNQYIEFRRRFMQLLRKKKGFKDICFQFKLFSSAMFSRLGKDICTAGKIAALPAHRGHA